MPVNKPAKAPRFQVDKITFSLQMIKAQIPIKFKCRFLVEIKNTSTTSSLKTLGKSKDQYRQTASIITFENDERFQFSQFMVFDNDLHKYKRTEIQIIVSLISDNRGDEVKLVGRIRVDLNEFMIDNKGETTRREQELQNCSVKKPQVAKLQYELGLVRQEKMNISQNPDREAIYSQIDRGVFADALEYNLFGKDVFGKDFTMISMSKINRSLNDSKVNGSREDIEGEREGKGSTKDMLNPSSKNISKKVQAIRQNDIKSLLSSSKNIDSLEATKKQQTQKKIHSQKQPKQVSNNQQAPHQQQQSAVTSNVNPQKQYPTKKSLQSPNQKSTQPISQQITQVQPQSQQKANFLTQSMFDEQQMVIESLQEQLQEAKEMIEQYKLEMELMKEQTERLQNEKSMHASELQTSRARNNSTSAVNYTPFPNEYQLQQQSQYLRQQVQQYKYQLQEYKKVFIQKQQIIEQKDYVIANLTGEIQAAAHEMEQRTLENDRVYNDLREQLMLVKEEEACVREELEKVRILYDKKSQSNSQYELMISDFKKEVSSLKGMVKSSVVAELSAELKNTKQHVIEFQSLLQQQRTNIVEYQLKVSDLQSTVQSLTKLVHQHKLNLMKSQQLTKKNVEIKERAEQEMNKAVEKAKTIEKEKYQLTQQIASMNLNAKNIDKLVDDKVQIYKTHNDELVMSYEQAQNKISELKFAVQSYHSTLDLQQAKSQSQISQLTQKLQNFNKKQHLLRQSLDLLENETTKIRNFVQQKQSRLRDYEELIHLKDEQLTEKNDKLNYLQRKQRMTENAINDLKLQLKMAHAMNLNAQDERPFSRDGQQELQTRLFILNEANMQLLQKQKLQTQVIDEREQAVHQLQKIVSTIEPLKRQLSLVHSKLFTSEQKYLELKQQLKTLNRNSFEQRSKADQQSSELQHAYKQCEKLQEQLNLLEDEKILMLNQYEEKDLEFSHVKEGNTSIKESVKSLEKQLHSKDLEINKIKKQLEQVQRINEELNRKITLLQASTISQHTKRHDLLIQSRNIITQDHEPISAIKSLAKDSYSSPKYTRSKDEEEIYRLNEELEAYKQREESYMCNVLDLQEQLEIVKKEKLSSSVYKQRQSIRKHSIQPVVVYDKKDLKLACDQLQKLIQQRIKNRETQNLIQMIVNNSQMMMGGSQSRTTNEQGTLFARQKNTLQEKSRILSREVQKIKSLIFKKADIPYKNKTQIIQLLKPCENITNELIKIAQDFARDNQDQPQSEN